MTSGAHDDGELGEIFLKLGKQGSTLAGVMDAFSIAVSIGLQYGVPLETYVSKFTNLRFEPAGLTDDPDVRMSQSIMDYIFRRLALDYLPFEQREAMGIYSADERQRYLETGSYEPLLEEIGSPSELIDAEAVVEVGDRGRRGEGRGAGRRGQGGPHLRRALREAHRHRRRLPALHDLRHQDAPRWLLLRLRGLRQHQRLQLVATVLKLVRLDSHFWATRGAARRVACGARSRNSASLKLSAARSDASGVSPPQQVAMPRRQVRGLAVASAKQSATGRSPVRPPSRST